MLCLLLSVQTANIILDPTTDANFWPRFLLQLIIILALCKLLCLLLGYLKQVQVIGEILAGIIVGPTVLGQWSWWSTHIFPTTTVSPASNNYITLGADVGIILFMFYVGLDLNEPLLRKQWKRAFPVAAAAIAFPFVLGVGLGAWLFDTNNSLLPKPVDRTAFYLFTGASMSFTALPVLASLLWSMRLIATPIGVQTISSATLDDVLAWCMLAISSAFAKGDQNAGGVTVALSFGYILFMFLVVRPSLARLHQYYRSRNAEDSSALSFVMLMTLLGSAFFCEIIQIHSFFGAFIAGLAAPKAGTWHIDTANKLELVTKELLLPLFFVSSGSRTNIGSITGSTLIGAVFVIWLVATAGKFIPACLMTKFVTRRSWRYATTVGVLMNTRGLVELIALNVGYSLGILSQQLFSVLVLMALLTTCCTSPLVHLLWIRSAEGRTEMAESKLVSDEYAEEVALQRTIAHLALSEQDARLAEFRAEREKRKQQTQGLELPSIDPIASPAELMMALSDEQQRVEQRYTLHAMSSVSDLDMERAEDTQQVVFPPLSRRAPSRHSSRGSLGVQGPMGGSPGVQPDDAGTPKHLMQSGSSTMRSGGRDVNTSQGRMTSGSYRLDVHHDTLREKKETPDEEAYEPPLNRSGAANDVLNPRSSPPVDNNTELTNSGSGASRPMKRTPHPADRESN